MPRQVEQNPSLFQPLLTTDWTITLAQTALHAIRISTPAPGAGHHAAIPLVSVPDPNQPQHGSPRVILEVIRAGVGLGLGQ